MLYIRSFKFLEFWSFLARYFFNSTYMRVDLYASIYGMQVNVACSYCMSVEILSIEKFCFYEWKHERFHLVVRLWTAMTEVGGYGLPPDSWLATFSNIFFRLQTQSSIRLIFFALILISFFTHRVLRSWPRKKSFASFAFIILIHFMQGQFCCTCVFYIS